MIVTAITTVIMIAGIAVIAERLCRVKKDAIELKDYEYHDDDYEYTLKLTINGEPTTVRGSGTCWNYFPSGEMCRTMTCVRLHEIWKTLEWKRKGAM